VYSRQYANVSVGPSFFDLRTGRYHSPNIPGRHERRIFNRLFFWVVNGQRGYQPGAIGLSGVNMGLPKEGDFASVDWLPGGCVLHRRDNLFLKPYYPYKGKAYAEDLFHSFLLRNSGVQLARCAEAKCYTPIGNTSRLDIGSLILEQLRYCRAMITFAFLSKSNVFRFWIFFVINNIFNLMRVIIR
jgi:hypothetical protein